MRNYKYIDKIVKEKIDLNNSKVFLKWEKLEEAVDLSNIKVSSSLKNIFSSLFAKISVFAVISSAVIYFSLIENNSQKLRIIATPLNVSYQIKTNRLPIINIENPTTPIDNKIKQNSKIENSTENTTIINVEITDVDTLRIK